MNSLVIFLAVVGAVLAVPQQRGGSRSAPPPPALILKQAADVNPDGSFQYSFETENGIRVSESGYLRNAGSSEETQVVQGAYSYVAPDGTPITVTYTADENGFKALGDHLPQAPAIPALIAKALAYNAANAQPEAKLATPNRAFSPFGNQRG